MAHDTSGEHVTAPDDTRVRVEHSRGQERYEAFVGDDHVGYLDYVREIDQVVITHTVIADRFADHGYGGQLVRHVLDDIATAGGSVVPVCPFVAHFVDEHPSYAAMTVPVGRRTRGGGHRLSRREGERKKSR